MGEPKLPVVGIPVKEMFGKYLRYFTGYIRKGGGLRHRNPTNK